MILDMAERPFFWILFVPLGLLVVSIMSFMAFLTWPIYILHRIGRWAYFTFILEEGK